MVIVRQMAMFCTLLLYGILAAYAQDKPAAPLKPMALTADPAFEVATIKPADPSDHNQGFNLDGHRISIESMTMTSLICFAYSIHKAQMVNGPQWFNEQTWNIEGIPDTEGAPNWHQYRTMLQKLLTVRFGLQMHHDKRELPVYALIVAKGGAKLEKSKSAPDAQSGSSGHAVGSQQYMKFTNNSMTDFAQIMQLMVDRPVIDQTGLSGRYDFSLVWTPDTLRAAEPDAAPGVVTAVQEQLGLKVEAKRAPTDVFVIDVATRPSQN